MPFMGVQHDTKLKNGSLKNYNKKTMKEREQEKGVNQRRGYFVLSLPLFFRLAHLTVLIVCLHSVNDIIFNQI